MAGRSQMRSAERERERERPHRLRRMVEAHCEEGPCGLCTLHTRIYAASAKKHTRRGEGRERERVSESKIHAKGYQERPQSGAVYSLFVDVKCGVQAYLSEN
jgi:hypothetical protein